jgi:hypothetical protein
VTIVAPAVPPTSEPMISATITPRRTGTMLARIADAGERSL